jgi:general secretion pathway protein C
MVPPRLITAAELLLAVWLAVMLADLFWAALWQPSATDPAPPAAAPAGPPLAAALPPPSAASRALFGMAAPADAAFGGPLAEAQLNLTLKGILAERDSPRQVALIADASGRETVYAIGDRVADATIAWIEPRRVVLARDGRHEALNLHAEELARTYRPPVTNADPEEPATASALAQELPNLLRQAQTEPFFEEGRAAGFRLVWIDPESLFTALGFRENDVIRSVNGIAVDDVTGLLHAQQQLQSETTFTVGVRRGGEELTFNVPLR